MWLVNYLETGKTNQRLSTFSVYSTSLYENAQTGCRPANVVASCAVVPCNFCIQHAVIIFITRFSVNIVRSTFLKHSLSILFHLPRVPPLHNGAAISTPAFSTPAILASP